MIKSMALNEDARTAALADWTLATRVFNQALQSKTFKLGHSFVENRAR